MIFKLNDTSLPAIMGYNNEKEGEFVGLQNACIAP